eukprot:CAMPEP_0174262816 /NCGR_PEP_ID=MMETSP0439-20130205/15662_1 /TAXON_ID=0 /ORGANISM="Stereomyxa ramosa, Strain Chinc5" /LENGTH=137 /DNA_ID=CAMNT_0015347799 /DNA_START=15 /DNA_END=428 /DNA_ORIENTATION=-
MEGKLEEDFAQLHNRFKANKVSVSNDQSGRSGSAASVFAEEAIGLMEHVDVINMLDLQLQTYKKITLTKKNINSFNQYSAALHRNLSASFDAHIKMVIDMKKDLENIFTRIRELKLKLVEKYPETKDLAPTQETEDG